MVEYYLFRGCLIPTRLPFLEKASRTALDRMGLSYRLLPDATCCIEPIGLRSLGIDTWEVTAARMLAIAERDDRDIIALCNGCFMSLKEAHHLLSSEEERERVNEVLSEFGLEYGGGARVKHLLEIVVEQGEDRIRSLVSSPLEGLRLGIHPGCHLVRPSQVLQVEPPFSPNLLAMVSEWLGAEAVHNQDWPGCCGGGLNGVDQGISLAILRETVEEFRTGGAKQILTPCPFCFIQFDLNQRDGLPVIYLGELLAMAFGASPEDIGLNHHRIPLEI